jgi:hypothetical protein
MKLFCYGTVSVKQTSLGTTYLKVNFACPNLLVRVSLHAQSYILNISSTSSSSLHVVVPFPAATYPFRTSSVTMTDVISWCITSNCEELPVT